MQIETDWQRTRITFGEMKRFLAIGWGARGGRVADAWRALNREHFKGKLEPIPIILVNTSPYGRWLGCTYCNVKRRRAHLIQLTMPTQEMLLVADRGTLLHEMLHQEITEQGLSPKHEHAPWCHGIMRLHQAITGERIWAAPETVAKLATDADGKRRSVRKQLPEPSTGTASLDRAAIAGWPHSLGLDLGAL